MKKIYLLLLLLLPSALYAKQVSISIAQRIADNFFNDSLSTIEKHRVKKRMVKVKAQEDEALYHIFQSNDGNGYVIISADDIAQPILGYSEHGDVSVMPENMRWWLNEYNREIQWAIEQGATQTEETKAEWDKLLKSPQTTNATVIVSPLIKTSWSQGTYYNAQCPYDSSKGKRCLTGCVATAMAQIMKYWNHPKQGRGENSYINDTYGRQTADFANTTYQWSSMPNNLTSSSTTTQKNAVSTLMYHCGVAVEMNYGVDRSGARSSMVEWAMKENFWYSDECRLLYKDDYTNSEWQEMLKAQLDAGRPLYYSGNDANGQNGHAFVCDGYRSDNYFHFNWGWDSSDGYFAITALKPTLLLLFPQGNFTYNQEALFNLYSKTDTISRSKLEMEDTLNMPDSIPLGSELHMWTSISNVGFKNFTGYIYVVAYTYPLEEYGVLDSIYVESLGWFETLFFDIEKAKYLPKGTYLISLQAYSDKWGEIWPIGNDYYSSSKQIVVYNPIELDWDFTVVWNEYHEKWYMGDSIGVINKINNNSNESIGGDFAIKLVNIGDEDISQVLGVINIDNDSITPHNYKFIRINGEIKVPAGEYYMYQLYRKDNQDDWNVLGFTDGHENPTSFTVSEKVFNKQYVILAQRSTSDNWYYLTNVNVGTEYTPHLEAVNSGTNSKDAIQAYSLEDKYLWEIEDIGNGYYLKSGNQYIAWSSGNTAYMDATGKLLKQTNSSSTYLTQYYFSDSGTNRYLSLNKDKNNNFFSFYKGTQAQDLLILEYSETQVITGFDSESSTLNKEVKKVIENGCIYFILPNGTWYNALGVKVK